MLILNIKNYYVIKQIIFDNTQGIEFIDRRKDFVLLAPNQTKHLYFIVKNNLTFDDRYWYDHPIIVRTEDGWKAETSIKTKPNFQTYDWEAISNYVSIKEKEVESEDKTIVKKMLLECEPSHTTYIEYDLESSNYSIYTIIAFLLLWFIAIVRNIYPKIPGFEFWGTFKTMLFVLILFGLMVSTLYYQVLILDYFEIDY